MFNLHIHHLKSESDNSPSKNSCSCLKYRQWQAVCTLVLIVVCLPGTHCTETINSLESLESLSEFALLRHHPQSMQLQSENVTESFANLVQDLQNQNFTADVRDFNCTLNSPGVFCQSGVLSKCMSVDDMLRLVPQTTKSVSEALARLCPLLLFQLHSDACSSAPPVDKAKLKPPSSAVWGYGVLFVTLISLCSLAGVLILPALSKSVYHTVLMLFEGLAVGSLAGSSLFHLIPQTFQLIGQDKEHGYLWKSLIIFCGIYLFYLSERLMKIIIDVRESKKKEKISFESENSTETLKSFQESRNGSFSTSLKSEYENDHLKNGSIPAFASGKVDNKRHYIITNGDANQNDTSKNYKLLEVEKEPCEHSHHHDHVVHLQQGGSTISTVAWMIIFGDGLHNFIDGLSIGAAFSESIMAGVSISVAVVCEEFPHELGDFAVLLSAGMTMKQALLYNFLSAITCYFGLIFGVLLGDLAEASPYVFALAAGMFLYISLVDMMGELAEAIAEARKKGIGEQLKVLFVQNAGIILGVAILFIMARYAEHFNFENLMSLGISESGSTDEHVQAFYTGLQEAKHLNTPIA